MIFKGYISSRKILDGSVVQQKVQNLVIRDACEKKGYDYKLVCAYQHNDTPTHTYSHLPTLAHTYPHPRTLVRHSSDTLVRHTCRHSNQKCGKHPCQLRNGAGRHEWIDHAPLIGVFVGSYALYVL